MALPLFENYDANFVSPRIAVGRYPTPADLAVIEAAGIRGIINTVAFCGRRAMEYVAHLPENIHWQLAGYWDGWLGSAEASYRERLTEGYARHVVAHAAEVMRAHSPVLVHCMAGIGRSGNLATILVAASENLSIEEANAQVRKYRTKCAAFSYDGLWRECDPAMLVGLAREILDREETCKPS